MMKITTEKTNIRTVKSDDPLFRIQTQFVVGQRAGFEISQHCPKEYYAIIQECFKHGWLKPVAYMTDQEYLMTALGKE